MYDTYDDKKRRAWQSLIRSVISFGFFSTEYKNKQVKTNEPTKETNETTTSGNQRKFSNN